MLYIRFEKTIFLISHLNNSLTNQQQKYILQKTYYIICYHKETDNKP